MTEKIFHLTDFVNTESPNSVMAEIYAVCRMIFPDFNFKPFKAVFSDVVRLFDGKYPGFRQSNTVYHDLRHTTDVCLAMAGLIHGAIISGEKLFEKNIALALMSALLHDSGYIQAVDDTDGTGAKYTQSHIQRSIEFLGRYFSAAGYSKNDIRDCSDILNCTGLSTKISDIKFRNRQIGLLGKMLGTADLLGQMGDRTYLEKLLFLFYEFREAGIGGYLSELDLLQKTIGFYELTKKRFTTELDNVNRFMVSHCHARWGVDFDIYQNTIDRNMRYLALIIQDHSREYRGFLRRGGYVRRLESMGIVAVAAAAAIS